jgi:hypothetical protein
MGGLKPTDTLTIGISESFDDLGQLDFYSLFYLELLDVLRTIPHGGVFDVLETAKRHFKECCVQVAGAGCKGIWRSSLY